MIRKFFGIVFILIAVVLLYSGYRQFMIYKQADQDYENLRDLYTKSDDTKDNTEEKTEEDFYIDWEALWSRNEDIIGWIRMDSGADYPVLYGQTNDTYLHADLNKNYSYNGCIFVNSSNNRDWSDPNTIIYGHNMKNGSMFGSNKKYKDEDYLKKHPVFVIYRPDGKYTYRIFHVAVAKDATLPYNISFNDREEYMKYLADLESNAIYDTKVSVPDARQIITLSTCTSAGKKRLIIQAYINLIEDYDGMIEKGSGNRVKNNAFP